MSDKKLLRITEIAIATIAIAMFFYQLLSTQHIFLAYDLHKCVHLGFALLLIFLSLIKTKTRLWPLFLGLAVLSVAITVYTFLFFDDMVIRIGFPTVADVVIGTLLLIAVLEATRRSFGAVLPIFSLAFIAYAFLGNYLPGPLSAPYFSAEHILSKLALDFRGIHGIVLGISVQYIFLFVIFGSIMRAVGAIKFFDQVGRLAGRRLSGGPAISSVASSALVGSVTGSASANILITGAFTIPLMKRAGYTPEQAGAIEAAASTVGQVTPPVMGAAAFVMAYFTGVPYIQLMAIAVLPALLTYFCMGLFCQFQAMKSRLSPMMEEIDYREMLRYSPIFFVPLLVLIVLMVIGYSPMYAIFWSILATGAISFIRKETRLSIKQWVSAITEGTILAARISAMCATIGIVVAIIISTGLGVKFPAAIESLSGGNIVIALVLTMFVSMLLGLGVPTTAAYILVALLVAPFLVNAGVDIVPAHFFVFYYAVFSLVTPPVAPGAVTASVLAQSKFFQTGFIALKVSIAAFLLPFLIIWCPILILQPENPILSVLDITATILILICLQILVVRYYFVNCGWKDMCLALSSIVVLLLYCYSNNYIFMLGVLPFAILTVIQLKKKHS